MSLRKALLAATVLALPLAAQAQPVTGLYIGAGAGVNFRPDATGGGLNVRTTDVGAVGLASVGWGFGNGLRVEAEGNFRTNDVSRQTVNGVRTAGNVGYLRTYGGMANVLYDFNLASFGLPPAIMPYIGAGVGYGVNDWQNVRGGAGGITYRAVGTPGNIAYQAIVGMAYGIAPGLAITGEYRYYRVAATSQNFTLARGAAVGATSVSPSNENHSILVGLRYNFGAAPPPPPPPPARGEVIAPTAARTFLVFFDWNRADLTPRAREIITEAANTSRTAQVTRLEVSGHADRSGTDAYNQRLSLRRAEVVAADLVRHGVARGAISIQAFGESRPLVPTADGVREPQNRRVEIVLK
jgi:outer membrane protein OmpA-like peptidoglycan-associated protein